MTEEEKKAIERMYDLIHTCEVGIEKHGQYDDLFDKDKQAIETVLNLISNLQKQNEEKDKQINKDRELKRRLCKEVNQVFAENKEKDKQIHIMAEKLTTPIHSVELVEKYYENLVKEKGE